MFNSPQISHVKDPKRSNHAPLNSIQPNSTNKKKKKKKNHKKNQKKKKKKKKNRFKSATIEFNSAQISHKELNSAQINHIKNPKRSNQPSFSSFQPQITHKKLKSTM